MPDTHFPRRFAVVHSPDSLAAENARLIERVRELEHLLRLERSRNKGLERGLSALSERVVSLRNEADPVLTGRGRSCA